MRRATVTFLAVIAAGTAAAQSVDQIDSLCVQTAMKHMGPMAARVTDVKVDRSAPPSYDHADKPGFRRYLRIETTIGTFKSVTNYRCAVNFGVMSAVPDR
jgi:hypothetical protein